MSTHSESLNDYNGCPNCCGCDNCKVREKQNSDTASAESFGLRVDSNKKCEKMTFSNTDEPFSNIPYGTKRSAVSLYRENDNHKKASIRNSNPPKKTVIVKLGGSAATVKTLFETPNMHVIAETVKQINDSHFKSNVKLVVIHGAGSFGIEDL